MTVCRNQVITAGMGEIVDINSVASRQDLPRTYTALENQRDAEKVSKTFRFSEQEAR